MSNQDQATPGEVPMAKNLAQLEVLAKAHNIHPGFIDAPCAPRTEFETPSTLGLLGRYAWTLKCLTEDMRGLTTVLYGDQRANAMLALRHLEDAHHRMTLAQASESTTVSSDKQKIENLARQCVRNAETIKDLRAKLE